MLSTLVVKILEWLFKIFVFIFALLLTAWLFLGLSGLFAFWIVY